MDQEEDLLLDMHYSLIRERTWDGKICAEVAAEILRKLRCGRESLQKALSTRVPLCDPRTVLNEWESDLEALTMVGIHDSITFYR